MDKTNWRAVFPNEKREFSAGCTEDRRAGRRTARKGGPAGCRIGQPSGPPFSAAHQTTLLCSLPARPSVFCAARQPAENPRFSFGNTALQPAGPPISVIPSGMWPFWVCLNRLWTAMGLCKATLVKWSRKNDGDTSCLCGEEQQWRILIPVPCYKYNAQKRTLLPCLLMQDCAWNTGGDSFKLDDDVTPEEELRAGCYCYNLSVGAALNARFTTNGTCAKSNTHIYIARKNNNRVIVACDLYHCLLPQCEALRTCRSGFLIQQYNMVSPPLEYHVVTPLLYHKVSAALNVLCLFHMH